MFSVLFPDRGQALYKVDRRNVQIMIWGENNNNGYQNSWKCVARTSCKG